MHGYATLVFSRATIEVEGYYRGPFTGACVAELSIQAGSSDGADLVTLLYQGSGMIPRPPVVSACGSLPPPLQCSVACCGWRRCCACAGGCAARLGARLARCCKP